MYILITLLIWGKYIPNNKNVINVRRSKLNETILIYFQSFISYHEHIFHLIEIIPTCINIEIGIIRSISFTKTCKILSQSVYDNCFKI